MKFQVAARNVRGLGAFSPIERVVVADPPQTVPRVQVRVAFGTRWNSDAPAWTDVTGDAQRIEIRRGRQYELARTEAGSLALTLDNLHGDYYPGNAGGAHHPNVLPRKRVNVRATWNAITYDVFDGYVSRWLPRPLPGASRGALREGCLVECRDGLAVLARAPITHAGWAQSTIAVRLGNILSAAEWPTALRNLGHRPGDDRRLGRH